MPIGIFIFLFGYLLGSVPTGLLLTKLFSKVDQEKQEVKILGQPISFERQENHWVS